MSLILRQNICKDVKEDSYDAGIIQPLLKLGKTSKIIKSSCQENELPERESDKVWGTWGK